MMSVDRDVLRKIASYLISVAERGGQSTYGEVGATVGIHHRVVGWYLGEVVRICLENRYPPLSVLVGNKRSGKPSSGLFKAIQKAGGYQHAYGLSEDGLVKVMREAVLNVADWHSLRQAFELEVGDSETADDSYSISPKDDLGLRDKATAAKPYPPKSTSLVTQYKRDPNVQKFARVRANGRCQLCGEDAPFSNQLGEPYLEVHHVQWLSHGGADVVTNVVALCPNCHRKMHVLDDQADVSRLFEVAAMGVPPSTFNIKVEVMPNELQNNSGVRPASRRD